jgi:hypothetical protein
MTSTKYTRQDYMNKVCSHSEYYGQFVTKGIKALVLRTIGEKKLIESKKEYFNDIPLHIWDGLAIQRNLLFMIDKAYSLAGAVCILKEAARQIVEEKKTKNSSI